MSAELYAGFVAATLLLVLLPGPNVALIVANSVVHGRKYGLVTVAGTSAAMVPQLALAALGMTGILSVFGGLFDWIRWIGIAYLVWLGVQAWRADTADLTKVTAEPRTAIGIFLRGFLVSLTNPKTLLFYGAFFPQFVTPAEDVATQIGVLSVTFLAIAVFVDSCWALGAARLRAALAIRGRSRNRLAGVFYIAAAFGLAAVRKPA